MRWKSMRLAMLCEHKYVAMVNNFGDAEKTSDLLEKDGAINMRSLYEVGKRSLAEQNSGIFASDNITKVESRIDQFIGLKRDNEMDSIFSDKDNRMVSDESELVPVTEEENVNYKKPLEKVIEEDSDIDYGRLVDPSYGTSGLHEFIPATKIKGMEDFVFESDHYRYYSNTTDFPLKIEMDLNFKIPENLQLYTYEQGNISTFRSQRRATTGVSSHFLMDGASVLPPLVLNVQPGDHVFDACKF
jgi:5-methylcytosine rRNA methyltransferase NSUN4